MNLLTEIIIARQTRIASYKTLQSSFLFTWVFILWCYVEGEKKIGAMAESCFSQLEIKKIALSW